VNGATTTIPIVGVLGFALMLTSPALGQERHGSDYLGTWEYEGGILHFTFVLRPDGTGYLADEVDTFPFRYSLDARLDPAPLDLTYDVDMAFGRFSETLVSLERSDAGDLLHWVSHPLESARPTWPGDASRAPPDVTWMTFHRTKPGHSAGAPTGRAF